VGQGFLEMTTIVSISAQERTRWDAFVAAHPCGHLLQSFAWGELKAAFAWEPLRLALVEGGEIYAGAQVLFRRVPLLSMAYVPRGPVLDWENEAALNLLLQGIAEASHSRRAVFLKIEPNLPDAPSFHARMLSLGFRSAWTVQPRSTLLVDLTRSEEDLLAGMRKHTRYGIRLARREAVGVRPATGPEEVARFYDLLRETARRKHFRIHPLSYYRRVYSLFNDPGQAALLFAEREGEILAALWVVAFGPEAIYMYAASRNQGYMAPSLLLWEAIRWAKAGGCTHCDLWGIPNRAAAGAHLAPIPQSEVSDPLWGVYIFKRGFGGRLARTVGAYDLPYRPFLYGLYRRLVGRQ
jgi:lipid II:glycine glycyltransferase (peptidoglycan interpeptide bridge formation enzyme)